MSIFRARSIRRIHAFSENDMCMLALIAPNRPRRTIRIVSFDNVKRFEIYELVYMYEHDIQPRLSTSARLESGEKNARAPIINAINPWHRARIAFEHFRSIDLGRDAARRSSRVQRGSSAGRKHPPAMT